eukprot:tig00000396_g24890.t1
MRSLHNRALLADQAYTVEVDSSKAKKAGNVDISVTATDENYGMASQTVKATVEPASAAAQAPATTSPSSGSTSTGTGTSGSSSTDWLDVGIDELKLERKHRRVGRGHERRRHARRRDDYNGL